MAAGAVVRAAVWWVPRPSAGASSMRHASLSVGRLAWGGRQYAIKFKMCVAVHVAVVVVVEVVTAASAVVQDFY